MSDGVVIAAIASMFSLVIGRIIFDWLKSNKSNNGQRQRCIDLMSPRLTAIGSDHEKILAVCDWIKEIHEQRDDEGVPMWCIPRAMKKIINDNHEKTVVMVDRLSEIRDVLKENQALLKKSFAGK